MPQCNAVCGDKRCDLKQWHNSPHSFEQRTGKRVCSVVMYKETTEFTDDEDAVDDNCKRPRGRAPNGTNGIPKTWVDGEGWVETLACVTPSALTPVSLPVLPPPVSLPVLPPPVSLPVPPVSLSVPPVSLPVPSSASSQINFEENIPDMYESEGKKEQRIFFASCCAALIDSASLNINMSSMQSLLLLRQNGSINDEHIVNMMKKMCNMQTTTLSDCSISQMELNHSLQQAREFARKGRGILYLETDVGYATQELLSHGVPPHFLHPCNKDVKICEALQCKYPKAVVEHGMIEDIAQNGIWIAIWYDTTSTWSIKHSNPAWNWEVMPLNFRNTAFCMVNLSSRCHDTDFHASELKRLLESERMGNGFSCWAHGYRGRGNVRNMVVGGGFYRCETPFPIHHYEYCSLVIPVNYFPAFNISQYLVRENYLKATVKKIHDDEKVEVVFLDKNGMAMKETDPWHPSVDELYRFRDC
tara:strand:- start:78 stop:1493 length:1416 start_codon:yes stop_codon:yes gene_type:complete